MNSKKSFIKIKDIILKNILLILTVLSVLIGLALGFILRTFTNLNPSDKSLFGFPGELFLRMLKFLIFPLIGTSLISGLSAISKTGKTGKILARALLYYLTTTVSAVIVALVLVSTIQPGTRVANSDGLVDQGNASNYSTYSTSTTRSDKLFTIVAIFDLLRNLFPDNIAKIGFSIYQSQLIPSSNLTNSSYLKISSVTRDSLNVLGLVMSCVVFTIVLNSLKEEGNLVRDFIETLYKVCVISIKSVMWLSPIGICFLVCDIILTMENINETFNSIPFYILTVLVGLLIQSFIVKPIFFFVITRKNVFSYFKNMLEALLFGFATSSSAATLPLTIKCVENKNQVAKIVTRFMLPIGTSINLDGTVLYIAVASVFLAQINHLQLNLVDLIIISITGTFASIGSAGVPAGPVASMVIMINLLNIPYSQISIFVALDWLLDRFVTFDNVWGNSLGVAIVERLSQKEIQLMDKDEENQLTQTAEENQAK